MSDERKKLISQQKSIPVLQFDSSFNYIAEYRNSIEAEKNTGVNSTHIRRVCNGVLNTAGGFIWKHKSDCNNIDTLKKEYFERINKNKQDGILKRKTTPICKLTKEYELIQRYDTVSSASKDTGIHPDTIRYQCKIGGISTGYRWVYEKDIVEKTMSFLL